MAEGKVGPGSQNKWKNKGTILRYPVDGTEFAKKTNGSQPNRNDSECWTSDTPVTWDDKNGDTAVASVATVGGIPNMLVTRDPNDSSKITEYHPLITFFNEVMARLMQQPGFKNKISNLDKEQNAIEIWNYLEQEYL